MLRIAMLFCILAIVVLGVYGGLVSLVFNLLSPFIFNLMAGYTGAAWVVSLVLSLAISGSLMGALWGVLVFCGVSGIFLTVFNEVFGKR